MSTLRISPALLNFGKGTPADPYQKAFKAAGEGWRGTLGKYPPQSFSAGHRQGKAMSIATHRSVKSGFRGYKRTGQLRAKAGYRLEVDRARLGGIYYTPYVIEPTRGRVAWPGKEAEAFLAAEKAFTVGFKSGFGL